MAADMRPAEAAEWVADAGRVKWRTRSVRRWTWFPLLVISSPGVASVLHVPASWVYWIRPGGLFIRGLTPLLPVAVGVGVLAWTERSRALGAFAIGFLGLAILVNLYDLENLFSR